MQRVECDGTWTLFCPTLVPNLHGLTGAHFNQAYMAYESSEIRKDVVNARVVWKAILESQIETGGPFMLYKDSINSELILVLAISYRR